MILHHLVPSGRTIFIPASEMDRSTWFGTLDKAMLPDGFKQLFDKVRPPRGSQGYLPTLEGRYSPSDRGVSSMGFRGR